MNVKFNKNEESLPKWCHLFTLVYLSCYSDFILKDVCAVPNFSSLVLTVLSITNSLCH